MRSIIFDLDLTLVASSTRESWISVLGQMGLTEEEALTAFRSGIGRPGRDTVTEALPRASEDEVEKVLALYDKALAAAPAPMMQDADEVLRLLHSAGHRLYLSTGTSPDVMESILLQHEWRELFALPLGSSRELPKGEKHLQAFAASEGREVKEWAADALTVGDGAGELRLGKSAGIAWRCAVLWPQLDQSVTALEEAGANLLILGLRELPRLAAARNPMAEWSLDASSASHLV